MFVPHLAHSHTTVTITSHVEPLKNHSCVPANPPIIIHFKHPTKSLNKANPKTNCELGEMEEDIPVIDAAKIRSHFLAVLRSRRSGEVPLTVKPAKTVVDPLYQDDPPRSSEVMESCPKANVENLKELLKEENLYLYTEAGEQGRLPLLILSMKGSDQKKPAVVFLHSTNKCKEWLRPLLEAYASRGYVAIAIDSRYHGERATSKTTYRDALVSSWKSGDTMPFIFDTVWDLIKLGDYLTQREDIDPTRIGITGESLGGMHAWFAAAADTRFSVVVPIIGVQGFRWALENDKWQGRVDSIKAVFEEARIDLGKSAIDKEVVEKVWDRIAPGLASSFDSPYTIPAIAPRPLLIVNGAEDPRCPLAGLEIPQSRASKIFEEAHFPENFKLIAQPGIGHQMTPLMVKEASDWFDKFL
ncbi:Abhydrolase_6 domain-containing protein [Cephalotus follicularis]|uniref:Abhydrolase_6 domain-containing protein n=1 Tax=Cephalotus follicularis TaxID=3775 RepID=A0A1Q3DCR3_CEPFO|nr:Abhydrolase_6 domain-containing protein [Cephalotus follicularis]